MKLQVQPILGASGVQHWHEALTKHLLQTCENTSVTHTRENSEVKSFHYYCQGVLLEKRPSFCNFV
jgi:hypothetical protein